MLSCSFCTEAQVPIPGPLHLAHRKTHPNTNHPLEYPAKQKTKQWDHCGCHESPGKSQGLSLSSQPTPAWLLELCDGGEHKKQGVFLHSSSCWDGAAGRATQQILVWCPDTLTERRAELENLNSECRAGGKGRAGFKHRLSLSLELAAFLWALR